MGAIWFWLVAFILALYVVLDGFDLGVGALHLLVARTNLERETSLRTIGPVWDGNEVWLVATAGTLYFAFPLLYASAFSGFYLPLMIVLWLLILRGIAVELRTHFSLGIWQDFFDGLFFFASALLAILFGAALANVIRGVPIGPDSYFFLPLWSNFRTGPYPGILDWYTLLGGILALTALAEHGALYLALKTEGAMRKRAHLFGMMLWLPLVGLTTLSLGATIFVRRQSLANYVHHPAGFIFPAAVAAGLGMMLLFMLRENDARSFACSALYLAAMLLGAAFALYPVLMPSSVNPAYDITISKAIAGHYGLSFGLIWWGFGMALAAAYFVFVYWTFRGRLRTSPQHGREA
ncbi:MAG: cytochrome d ubiquinol oxidase subunit II [Silvibacterium sp.]